MLAVPLRRDGAEYRHALRAGEQVVDLDGERARGQFLGLGEERNDFVVALIVTGERAAPRNVPVKFRSRTPKTVPMSPRPKAS